jgi:hypothetical protein
MYARWTKDDDERLWASRSEPTAVLAGEFHRSEGGIRSRLKHLQNPDHHAYQRLLGTSTTGAIGVSKSLSTVNVARHMLAAAHFFDAASALTIANPRSTVTRNKAPIPVLSDYTKNHSAASTNTSQVLMAP